MVFQSGEKLLKAANTKPIDIESTRVSRLPLVSEMYPHNWAPATTPAEDNISLFSSKFKKYRQSSRQRKRVRKMRVTGWESMINEKASLTSHYST